MRITLKSHVLFCLLALPLLTSACVLGDGFDEDALFEDPIEDEVIEPEEEFTPTPTSSAVTRPEGLRVYEPENNQPRTRAVGGEDLLLLEDATLAVASDASTDALYFVDVRGGSVSATAQFEEGANPGRISSSQEGVYVVLRDAGEVALVGFDGVIKERVTACPAPRGVAMDTTREKVWVSCASSELVSFSPATLEKLDTFYIDADLRDVVANQKGLYVARFRAAEILSIDPDSGEILERTHARGFTSRGESAPGELVNSLWRMIGTREGHLAFTYQQTPTEPLHVTVLPEDPDEGISDIPSGYGHSRGGCSMSAVSSSHGAITLLADGRFDEESGHCSNAGVLPVDIEDTSCGLPMVLSASPMLVASQTEAPMGSSSNNGCLIFPHLKRTHTKLAATRQSRTEGRDESYVLLRGDDLYIRLAVDGEGEFEITLCEDSAPHVGQMLFHGDAGAGIACASCHPEGGDDGHAWLFSISEPASGLPGKEVVRRTQNLRAGVEGKLHWTGEFETLDGLMRDVFSRRMGGFSMLDSDVLAIEGWIDQLSPEPGLSIRPESLQLAEQGQALFTSTGCADCHAGSMLTDYSMHDVGTGGPRKTPTLRGIAQRTRWMSDGCAKTLFERFGQDCGGDLHGNLEGLPEADKLALVVYLETL